MIVIGAGEVGSSIASELAGDHEVVIVDVDSDRVEELTYSMDVLPIEGDGTDLSTLEEAGVAEADMLIASTDSDEANIVACGAATAISDPFTVARVKRPQLLETWERARRAFGVDFMVCTDLLTAETIVNIVGLPAAHDVDPFAEGLVQMAEFEVPEGSSVAEQTVEEADRFESLTFVGVLRNDHVEIARGDTRLHAGDFVVVIGSPESVRSFAAELSDETTPTAAEEIVVVGGSEIGYQATRLFEERGLEPRLIEQEHNRARELAERLPRTMVMESDATDVDFLTREHVDEADVVVAALTHDEMNLLVALLARQLGVARTVAVVESSEYVDLFETVGVNVAVSPRQITAEEITRFTLSGQTEKVSLIHNDLAEAIEIEVGEGSVLTGRAIRDAMADLPEGVVIGAITRADELVIPRGDTVVEPGDHVIVFAKADRVDAVTEALS